MPGDYNGDGIVDGADFLLWQRDPGIGSLSDWQTDYGLTTPSVAASTAVTEPGALMLTLAAVFTASHATSNW